MKKLFLFFLITSLTANAWLFLRTPAVSSHQLPGAEITPAAQDDRPDAGATKLPPAVVEALRALESADLAAVRDTLRMAGLDESSIRGVIEGAWRARLAMQVEAARGVPGGASVASLRSAMRDSLRQLLGVDPLDVTDAEARYDFLSDETRRKLARIDLDYSDLRARSAPGRSGTATKAELDEQKLLADERRKDVLSTLTEAERAEYDLRFSREAVYNSSRFATLGVTEQEFRTLQPIVAEMSKKNQALSGAARLERAAVEQETVDRLVAAVGYERALDYMWGTYSGPYKSTVQVLQSVNQPPANAGKLLQLAAETGVAAATIHRDATLTPEEKRTALVTLQQTIRPQIDALVPPDAQSRLDEKAIGWFKALGEGRYIQPKPVLFGDGYSSSAMTAVSSPVVSPPLIIPVPRRGRN